MSQPLHPTTFDQAGRAIQPTPAEIRTSNQRASEIRQYVLGLLPAHISERVDVIIAPGIRTAAVLPATEDALVADGQGAFARQQAKQLVSQVDGEYLVLITGNAAPEGGPISDELSADRAHQFGLAFHETLHILKTAFGGIRDLMERDVDEQYQGFVHSLINTVEDGAIEREVYVGEDFSERASNRLRYIRALHKRSPDDYADLPESASEFTFRDALEKALHDNVILPPSGTTTALLDENDERVTFASDAEQAAFLQIYPEIEQLAEDIHGIRGDTGERLHHYDPTASIRRAKRTIDFWKEVVKPLVDDDTSEHSSDDSDSQQAPGQESGQDAGDVSRDESSESGEQGDASSGQENDQGQGPSDPSGGATAGQESSGADGSPGDQSVGSGSDPAGDASGAGQQRAGESPESSFDPEDLSLENNAIEEALQGVGDHPQIGEEPAVDDVSLDSDPQTSSPDQPAEGGDSAANSQPSPDDGSAGPDDSSEAAGPGSEATDAHDEAGSESGHGSDATGDVGEGDVDSENVGVGGESCGDGGGGGGVESDGADHGDGSDGESVEGDGENVEGDGDHDPGSDGAESAGASSATPDQHPHTGDSGTSPSPDSSGSSDSSSTTVETTSGHASSLSASANSQSGRGQSAESQASLSDFGSATSDPADSSQSESDATGDEGTSQSAESREPTDAEDTSPSETPDGAETVSSGSEGGSETDGAVSGETSAGSEEGAQDNSTGADTDSTPSESVDDSADADGAATDTSTTGDLSHETGSTLDDPQAGEAGDSHDDGAPGSPTDSPGSDDPDDPVDPVDQDPEGPMAGSESPELTDADFEADRKQAQRTADDLTPDIDGLHSELEQLDDVLGEERDTGPDGSGSGGQGAGPGSISELTLLPEPTGERAPNTEWDAIEQGAELVGDELAKQLRLDQQTETRAGLTSGRTVNPKLAHRLGYGDPRVFEESIAGDEKEYFVVLVLDRSGSMGPGYNQSLSKSSKISVATRAVARFALACEALDIDVAVIDFYNDEARLAKPASIDTEFAQETLLDCGTEGGTPLKDALTLATNLADMDSRESIIISMTDGMPRDTEAVKELIKRSYAPICSVTIATDCAPGNPPDRAVELEPHYDQTTTIYDPETLDDKLDKFASLLGAY